MYLVIFMKKIISVFLATFMLIFLLSFSVFAENKVNLTLTSETVYAGAEFKLNLFISDNSKMSGAVIDVNYDKDMLKFVKAEQGAILDSSANISIKNFDGENAKVRFTYLAPDSSVTSEGVIMTITFKALENATGNTDLKITIPNAADFVTQDLKNISYEVKNSVVKIINTTYEEQSEDISSSTADGTSQPTDKDTQSTTEKVNNDKNAENDKNNGDTLIVVLLVVGLLFITVGVVMLVQSKKKKE